MKSFATLLLATLLLALFCTTDSGTIAGGTGAGNPSGVISFAIVTDSAETVLAKGKPSPDSLPSKNRITLKDNTGSSVEISEVTATIAQIHFNFQNPDAFEPTSSHNELLYQHDKKSIYLSIPVHIDIMKGTVTPDLDSVVIPALPYKGISVVFETIDTNCAISVSGTYRNDNKSQPFTIILREQISSEYLFTGQPLEIVANQTFQTMLKLSAPLWLSGIDLGRLINNQKKPVKPNELLIIDSSEQDSSSQKIIRSLQKNIVLSGKLLHKKQ